MVSENGDNPVAMASCADLPSQDHSTVNYIFKSDSKLTPFQKLVSTNLSLLNTLLHMTQDLRNNS